MMREGLTLVNLYTELENIRKNCNQTKNIETINVETQTTQELLNDKKPET